MSDAEPPPHIFELSYYERIYETEEHNWWSSGMRETMNALLRRLLVAKDGLRVLDAGCGTGYLLQYFGARYPVAGPPVGVDVSEHALRFCRQRDATALGLASVIELPFRDGCFDLVICIDTIQHLAPADTDMAALREFARVLTPGGLLYLRTNSALGHVPLQGTDPDLYRRYRRATVAGMLAQAGFDVERATYLNMLPGAWAALGEYSRYYRSRFMRSAGHAGKTTVAAIGPGLAIGNSARRSALTAWLGSVALALEGRLVAAGIDLPFGHSTAFVARRCSGKPPLAISRAEEIPRREH